MFEVTVCYAKNKFCQKEIKLKIEHNTTVEEVINKSKIMEQCPEINYKYLSERQVGIWGEICNLNDIVKNNDRIEIYRPLKIDPKEMRKIRAQQDKNC